MQARTQQTLTIEQRLTAGESVSAIARDLGISRQRVIAIKHRGLHVTGVTGGSYTPLHPVESRQMKALTINFTPAVYRVLVEACQIVNSKDSEEQITLSDYVEQLTINNLVEMGLMRKDKRR